MRAFCGGAAIAVGITCFDLALANKCDAIVATVMAEPQAQSVVEAQALDFLRSAAVQHWAEAQGGSQ